MEVKPRITMVVGMQGSGKSRWVKKHYLSQDSRLLVFDVNREYPLRPGIRVEGYENLMRYLGPRLEGPFRISFVPIREDSTDEERKNYLKADLVRVCELVEAIPDCHLIVEEVGETFRPQEVIDGLLSIARVGRHDGQRLTVISQGVTDIPKTIRKNADRRVFFNTHEPDDLRYARGILGERADVLPMLERCRGLMWEPGEGVSEVVL